MKPINTLDSIHLEIEEVCSIPKSLQVGKAWGPDMINNRILKEIADSVSPVRLEEHLPTSRPSPKYHLE